VQARLTLQQARLTPPAVGERSSTSPWMSDDGVVAGSGKAVVPETLWGRAPAVMVLALAISSMAVLVPSSPGTTGLLGSWKTAAVLGTAVCILGRGSITRLVRDLATADDDDNGGGEGGDEDDEDDDGAAGEPITDEATRRLVEVCVPFVISVGRAQVADAVSSRRWAGGIWAMACWGLDHGHRRVTHPMIPFCLVCSGSPASTGRWCCAWSARGA
jgi:hypothetical protein